MINPADARVRDTGIPPLTQFSYKIGCFGNWKSQNFPQYHYNTNIFHSNLMIQFKIISNLLLIKKSNIDLSFFECYATKIAF